jgi:uncharacterized protein (DUF362 family)
MVYTGSGISRRHFLEVGLKSYFLLMLGKNVQWESPILLGANAFTESGSIIVTKNGSASELVESAIDFLGGMNRFVSPGDSVLIKPNASFNNVPEKASTTNPDVASAVVDLCFNAGASEVFLADHLLQTPASRTLSRNGLKDAAENSGAKFIVLERASDFENVEVQGSRVLQEVDVSSLYFDCDTFINLPVMKHHSATGSTLGMKNLMGLIWNRSAFHRDGLEECIADLSLVIKPNVTIIDATRALMTNGPRGPGDVVEIGQVIAGTDPVAVDVAALTIGSSLGYRDFNLNGTRNRYINIGTELGIGDGNPASVASKTTVIDVSKTPTDTTTEPIDNGSPNQIVLPDWLPFASLSAATAAIGAAALYYSRRRERVAHERRQ